MKPTVFCLTPVRNEEWIIGRFLKAASIWADKIILSDQGSTDKTVEIAKRFPKVSLIDNSGLKEFDEQAMRAPLFAEARKTPGKRILISLDADELFTPNFDSPEWNTLLEAEEGTRFRFNELHIRPDFRTVFTTVEATCAFVDDGSEYNVGLIHVPRQPVSLNCKTIKMNSIEILHFQFTNWERMERKHIWYQMYERIHYPGKSIITIYRTFHWNRQFIPVHNFTLRPFLKEWVDGYSTRSIDITSVTFMPDNIWDDKIIEYINRYSSSYFNRIAIWDVDWAGKASGREGIDLSKFADRRSCWDKALLSYLRRSHDKRNNLFIRVIDRILKKCC